MPDVAVEKGVVLDLLDQQKPRESATNDVPVVETRPDAVAKPDAAAEPPAKEEVSATSETVDATAAPDAEKPKAKGVQKRIDELTRQREEERRARLATEERLERALGLLETAMKGPPPRVEASGESEPVEPDASKYTDQAAYNTDYRKYLKDLARHEGRQAAKEASKTEREEQQKQAREERNRKVVESYNANVEKAREKYPDYDAVVYSDVVPFTSVMTDAIVNTDNGPDIAYHLAQNPQEVARIAKFPPARQLMELGLIAAKITEPKTLVPPVSQVSHAPKPITPLSGSKSSGSIKGEESMEEYAARRAKELSKDRVPGGVRR